MSVGHPVSIAKGEDLVSTFEEGLGGLSELENVGGVAEMLADCDPLGAGAVGEIAARTAYCH